MNGVPAPGERAADDDRPLEIMAQVTAWRLVGTAHAESAFSGEGARLFGGRWNSKGRAVCYLADSPALCQLEVLANTRNPRQLQSKLLFRARFGEQHVEALARNDTESKR